MEQAVAMIARLRERGLPDEQIGFRIGWHWASERTLKHATDEMVQMCALHENEKKAMLSAWKAHHELIVRHLQAGQPGVGMCVGFAVFGFVMGGLLI